MSQLAISGNTHEKQRQRDQIRSQVEEFLRRGGTIEVFDNARQAACKRRACGWHEQSSLVAAIE